MVKGLKSAASRTFSVFSYSGMMIDQIGDKVSLLHPSFKPVNVFLLAGTNNIPHLNQTPGQIFLQYEALIAGVKAKFPTSNIQVISILPRGFCPPFKSKRLDLDLPSMGVDIVGQRISKVNKLLQTNAVTHNYTFIDIHDKFLSSQLTLQDMYYEFNDVFSLHLSHHGYSLLYEHITRYNYPSRYLCKCSTFNVSCEGDCWNSYLAIKFSDPLENPFTIQLDNRQREGETTHVNVGPVRKECSFTVQLVKNKVSLYICKVTVAPAVL